MRNFNYADMIELSSKLKFEEAESIKQKYKLIESYHIKTSIVQPVISNVDVYSYYEVDNSAYINYFYIIKGAIIRSYTFEYKKRIDDPKEEILAIGISEMREMFNSPAK